MPQVLAVVGAVASVVGTVGNLAMQSKANRLAARAADKQQQQQELQSLNANRASVRQAQLARARAVMSAVGSGAVGGSGFFGGIGGLTSQLGAGLGYQTQYNSLSGDVSRLGTASNAATNSANLFSGIASIGGQLFDAGGGFDTLLGMGQQSYQPPVANFQPTYRYTSAFSGKPNSALSNPAYNPVIRPYGNIM